MTKRVVQAETGTTLPVDGMSRWKQIAPFSPFSREKFRQLVKEGKAPQPVKFSQRCSAYSNRELHLFFADPLNYSAQVLDYDPAGIKRAPRRAARRSQGARDE